VARPPVLGGLAAAVFTFVALCEPPFRLEFQPVCGLKRLKLVSSGPAKTATVGTGFPHPSSFAERTAFGRTRPGRSRAAGRRFYGFGAVGVGSPAPRPLAVEHVQPFADTRWQHWSGTTRWGFIRRRRLWANGSPRPRSLFCHRSFADVQGCGVRRRANALGLAAPPPDRCVLGYGASEKRVWSTRLSLGGDDAESRRCPPLGHVPTSQRSGVCTAPCGIQRFGWVPR